MISQFEPTNWYWIVAGDTSRAWSSAAASWVASWPDGASTRISSEADLCDVLRKYGLACPVPSAADVKAEAQRRIIAIMGATDITQCFARQLNANMRATELSFKVASGQSLTESETLEAASLSAIAAAIKSIRSKSNEIEAMSPIPIDFRSDAYWTP